MMTTTHSHAEKNPPQPPDGRFTHPVIPVACLCVAEVAGMLASIAGAELAVRFPRKTMVILIMGVSGMISLSIGFCAGLDPAWPQCWGWSLFHGSLIKQGRPGPQ